MSKPEWTDRRRWNYGLLLFTATMTVYAFLNYPLAPRESLIATTLDALITACIVTTTGFTIGKLAEKSKMMKGKDDVDTGA